MPLHCPHCRIAQAEENETCINCGQPLTPLSAAPAAPAAPMGDPALLAEAAAVAHLADHDDPAASDPIHVVQAQRAAWRLPALIAVGLLLALAAWSLLAAQRRASHLTASAPPAQAPETVPPAPVVSPPSSAAAPLPPAPAVTPSVVGAKPVPTTKAAGAKTAAVPKPVGPKPVGEATPLTVTLASTSAGRHVKAGDGVTLTALAETARGQSATLTIFCRQGKRSKTMIGFGQGSLWSGIWTPRVPGRYELTATALGDSRPAATSRPVEITVDQPAPPTVAHDQTAMPDRTAQALPRVAAAPPRRVSDVLPKPAATTAPRAAASAKTPASALVYHVAAAQFAFSRSAVVLADALSRRGSPALPERMADRHGKTVYVVVTGSYRRPKEARAAALALQRSGYPAYFFSSR